MTLNDLKDGMVVVLRNGDPYIVLRNVFYYGDILAGYKNILEFYNTQISLTRYNADMTFKNKSMDSFDIMEIYEKPEDIFHEFFKKGKLIWKRKEHNDGWIPCSERLPGEHDSMFATLKGTSKWNDAMFEKASDDVNVTVEFEDGTRKTKTMHTVDGEWKNDSFINMEIIAWRPLPEPYKEDEGE